MFISCSRCSDGSMWLPFWWPLSQIVCLTLKYVVRCLGDNQSDQILTRGTPKGTTLPKLPLKIKLLNWSTEKVEIYNVARCLETINLTKFGGPLGGVTS